MIDPELTAAINSLAAEHKSAVTDLVTKFNKQQMRLTEMQTQLDAVDAKTRERLVGVGTKSLTDLLQGNDSVARLLHDKKGTAIITLEGADADIFESKTTITSTAVGAATSGVLQIGRIPGIVPEARQQLTVRDVLTSRPTTFGYCDFVKVDSPMTTSPAMMQTEASAKFENSVTFRTVSEKVKTVATWIPASRQVLDDFAELGAFIDGTLRYYLNLEEELQLLSGDAQNENLNGLITQATGFDTGLLSNQDGWNLIDQVGLAIQQLATAKEFPPSFAILNPADWGTMRLTKDSTGHYILGDPQSTVPPALFGLRVIPTTSIGAGGFLVGSGDAAAAEIRDRMQVQVEVSTSHADYFTKNLLAVRAEKRLCLCVKRPGSYIYGVFSTSPA
jgi:HK97 family phage major capsid protein